MAEVFGTVAGGIGAVSLAIQLIDKAGKLHNLVNSIKDAPSEIRELLPELELLAATLTAMEDLYSDEMSTSVSKIGVRALEHCHEVTTILDSLVSDLDTSMKRSRNKYTWNAM